MIYSAFVIGYLIFICLVGFYYMQRIKTQQDFAVAGKSLPGIVLAGTLLATAMGSGSVVGGTNSLGYLSGPWVALVFSLGLPAAGIALYCLSKYTKKLDVQTIPELLELKYGSSARLIGSVIIMMAFVGIASYQFQGMAFILEVILGIPLQYGLVIAATLMLVTALTGGLYSVAYTDFISTVLMLIGLGIGVPMAMSYAGGFSAVMSAIPPENTGLGGKSFLDIFAVFLPLFLLIAGDQNVFQRFFAAKNPKQMKIGIVGWLCGFAVVSPLIAFGATTARALYPDIPAGQALIQLATGAMPSMIGAFTLASIAAFVLTTGNSYLLAAGVNLSWDIHLRFINPDATPKQKLRVSRFAVLGLAIFAYLIIAFFPSVLKVQMYAYTMYGAAITPALFGAILWKKATPTAGVGAMLTGASTTLVWEFLGSPFGLQAILVAAPAAVIALVALGLITYKEKN